MPSWLRGKAFGDSQATYYRWHKRYGSMSVDHVKRLKHLDKENSRLKCVVADLTLEKATPHETFHSESALAGRGRGSHYQMGPITLRTIAAKNHSTVIETATRAIFLRWRYLR